MDIDGVELHVYSFEVTIECGAVECYRILGKVVFKVKRNHNKEGEGAREGER